MPKVREPIGVYSPSRRLSSRKQLTPGRKEFVFDDRGNRVGVIIDLPSYEKLVEAQEELEDIHDFDELAERATAEYRKKEYVTLQDYKRQRKAKSK